MLSEHVPDLSTFSEAGLFSLYRAILGELKSRGVIRTENAPVGDYAEYLVATALGGQLAPNSEKSWDVLGSDGEKLQVKARVVSDPVQPGQLQLSPFRSFNFDFAVIVLLSATDYAVSQGVESASPRGRILCDPSAARERQGLVCPPGNHGPSRRNGPDRSSSGGSNWPQDALKKARRSAFLKQDETRFGQHPLLPSGQTAAGLPFC